MGRSGPPTLFPLRLALPDRRSRARSDERGLVGGDDGAVGWWCGWCPGRRDERPRLHSEARTHRVAARRASGPISDGCFGSLATAHFMASGVSDLLSPVCPLLDMPLHPGNPGTVQQSRAAVQTLSSFDRSRAVAGSLGRGVDVWRYDARARCQVTIESWQTRPARETGALAHALADQTMFFA